MESIRRVFIPSFLVDVELEASRFRSNFGGRGAYCSIGVVRGVVQFVLNWFTGIPNLT